jgi:hypothetical protein
MGWPHSLKCPSLRQDRARTTDLARSLGLQSVIMLPAAQSTAQGASSPVHPLEWPCLSSAHVHLQLASASAGGRACNRLAEPTAGAGEQSLHHVACVGSDLGLHVGTAVQCWPEQGGEPRMNAFPSCTARCNRPRLLATKSVDDTMVRGRASALPAPCWRLAGASQVTGGPLLAAVASEAVRWRAARADYQKLTCMQESFVQQQQQPPPSERACRRFCCRRRRHGAGSCAHCRRRPLAQGSSQ